MSRDIRGLQSPVDVLTFEGRETSYAAFDRHKHVVRVLGDRWHEENYATPTQRRDVSFELTRTHFTALRRVVGPREILVLPDVAHSDRTSRSYAEEREAWLETGATVLPDLVPELDSVVRWDAVGELCPCPGEGRRHVRIKPMFEGLSLALAQVTQRS